VYLGFLLPFIIPPTLHTHLSSGAGTVGPLKAAVPRDSASAGRAMHLTANRYAEPNRDAGGMENIKVFTERTVMLQSRCDCCVAGWNVCDNDTRRTRGTNSVELSTTREATSCAASR
jgi:hypothetical protein